MIGVGGLDEPSEEAFQCVNLVQLVGWPFGPTGEVLQIEVCAARDGGAGGPIGHSKISKASRRVRSDFGNCRAIASSSDGDDPRRLSQRFSAP